MIHCGDCLDVMRGMDGNSIDTIITDPPYALEFMGKGWDKVLPSVDIWKECLRVAKPGAMLMAFGGTRTYHRLTCAIEDAGWEIRDCVMWVYGSGFPKSHDIGKGIDRQRNDNPLWKEVGVWLREKRTNKGFSTKELCGAIGAHGAVNHGGAVSNWEKGFSCPTWAQWQQMQSVLGFSGEMDVEVWRLNGRKGKPGDAWDEREAIKFMEPSNMFEDKRLEDARHATDMGGLGGERLGTKGGAITTPATAEAQTWNGYGTALKPAWEPIVLAMKPLDGTFAQNALKWGVAGLWIDGGRVGTEGGGTHYDNRDENGKCKGHKNAGRSTSGETFHADETKKPQGRWPANLIHDGSEEVVGEFPNSKDGVAINRHKDSLKHSGNKVYGKRNNVADTRDKGYGGSGTAARFFYCAKASKAERNKGCEGMEDKVSKKYSGGIPSAVNSDPRGMSGGGERIMKNNHPTVKPVSLMRYLCRLTRMPEGGTVLDPFMGSGSTGIAAKMEGREFIGIDQTPEYCEIMKNRIEVWEPEVEDVDDQKEFGF